MRDLRVERMKMQMDPKKSMVNECKGKGKIMQSATPRSFRRWMNKLERPADGTRNATQRNGLYRSHGPRHCLEQVFIRLSLVFLTDTNAYAGRRHWQGSPTGSTWTLQLSKPYSVETYRVGVAMAMTKRSKWSLLWVQVDPLPKILLYPEMRLRCAVRIG